MIVATRSFLTLQTRPGRAHFYEIDGETVAAPNQPYLLLGQSTREEWLKEYAREGEVFSDLDMNLREIECDPRINFYRVGVD